MYSSIVCFWSTEQCGTGLEQELPDKSSCVTGLTVSKIGGQYGQGRRAVLENARYFNQISSRAIMIGYTLGMNPVGPAVQRVTENHCHGRAVYDMLELYKAFIAVSIGVCWWSRPH